ncbi:MAG: potassium-transporting ATPase subunit KdpA, partial [Erysipelotrichaceae bacterium]
TQIAIQQLGTNGGGFFGTNSAFPLENPTIFSNLIQMIAILLLPMSLCFAFGKIIKDSKQGIAIFSAMLLVLLLALSVAAFAETHATPLLSQNSSLDFSGVNQSLGNMEGKEARFGIASSVTWSIFTTAASNGSVNSMLNSYAPLSGFTLLVLMQLGEVIFGGAGSGLYGMIAFAILTVFIAGLMVGRTPEYLGKKIEPYEMKMTAYACLATPVAILVTSGIAAFLPSISTLFVNEGAHKFSEFLYMFTSAGANNGSAFAGVQADTLFLNTLLGISMIFARFVPMVAMLAVAGSLAKKKKVASSSGTLSTCNPMFVFLLVFVIVLIGALSFFPALSLGPIAEYLNMIV